MSSISPINEPQGSFKSLGGHTKLEKGKQQYGWLLDAYFALLQLEVNRGEISPKKAKEIESTLKHLHDEATQVTSEDQLRYMFATLNNQVGIVNGELKKLHAETGQSGGGGLFPAAELVEQGSERSGVMSHIQLFMNFIDEGANQKLISPEEAQQVAAQAKKVWEGVERGTLHKPDEAMGMLDGVIKHTNKLLPDALQFPRPSLSSYLT